MDYSVTATRIPLEKLAGPARRAIENAGFNSLEDIATASEREINALHGMAPSGVKVLRQILSDNGLSFGADA